VAERLWTGERGTLCVLTSTFTIRTAASRCGGAFGLGPRRQIREPGAAWLGKVLVALTSSQLEQHVGQGRVRGQLGRSARNRAARRRSAYRADLDHFRGWGGTIPATDIQVAAYLADHAAVLKVSTLTRRLAAISIAHDARDLLNPVRTPLVRATMRGIRREQGAAQHQAKALLHSDHPAVEDRPRRRRPEDRHPVRPNHSLRAADQRADGNFA